MPYVITPTPGAGQLKYEWIDRNGVLRDLTRESSPTVFVPVGSVGLGSPQNEVESDKLPSAAGNVVRHIRTQPLEIQLPLVVYKGSFGSIIQQMDRIRDWFYTGNEVERQPGYFRITRPDESVRQIECYYRGGLEGNTKDGSPTFVPYVIQLFAPDPLWTDIESTTITYDWESFGDSLLINNEGDEETYPIWTITGPASNIVLRNETQNRTISLTANGGISLASTQQLVIDTRPYQQRQTPYQIYDEAGTNRFSHVTATSKMWTFSRGVNRFRIVASGISAVTELGLQYIQRYRGALR